MVNIDHIMDCLNAECRQLIFVPVSIAMVRQGIAQVVAYKSKGCDSMRLRTTLMRICVSLLLITFMLSTRSQANSDVFVKQIQKGTSTYDVLCLADGTELHEPVPYPIDTAPLEGGLDGCAVFAYYDPITDNTPFAIYFESTGVFSGFVYHEVHDFSEGLAAVCSLTNRKFGYIDQKGNVIVPFQWEWAEDFKNGIALVTYQTFDDYRNVWINQTGEIVSIDPEWGYAIQDSEAEAMK